MMLRFLLLFLFGLTAPTVSPARIHKRLVNANVADYGQFPWMVSLRWTSTSSHTCGGSIVTPEHVVTAAHCLVDDEGIPILPSDIFVVTGHLNNIQGGRQTKVSELIIHPVYSPIYGWQNDIAVLKLATPIPFTATERPIPIASADVGAQPCVVSGWGRIHFPSMGLPSQLQTYVMNTITMQTCIDMIYPDDLIFNSTLCAGAVEGTGVCNGDSGGPLVCNGELAGVVSWAYLCANGLPDGYTRVFYYRNWLHQVIPNLSSQGKAYAADALEATNSSE